MAELGKVPFYNQVMDKTSMKQLIGRLVAHLGSRHTTRVLDQLKTLGFQYATQAGISLGIDDLVTTPSKGWLIQDAEQQAHLSEKLQQHGSIHAVEKLRQLVETWYTTSEYLKREMTPNFRMTNPLNPVHLMSFSGARGSVSQVHQLVGMRGLMSDPQGQIIDLPIQSNFREGLSLTEYIISCYGARKGVVDTAVRTADAGYLTRRLVEVVQHVVVRKVDCGTLEGVTLDSIQNHRGKPCVSWEQRLIGRVLAVSVCAGGQLVAPRNQEIGVGLANRLAASKATRVQIRSPMTCQGLQWVCQLCYGWSPSHGRMVAIGEAVGIIAGQSIGEPGTQLTLRTFHTGGVFTGDIAEHVRAPLNGVVHFDSDLAQPTRTRHGRPAFICQSALPVIIRGQERDHALRIPPKSLLLVSDKESVEAKQVIAEIRATTAPFKERVQKHIYSDLPGEMHWGKAVCHAPRRTRLSSLLATGHLWVLSGQLHPIRKQLVLFYQKSDHIDQYQPIGDEAWISWVRRAKCANCTRNHYDAVRLFQQSLVCSPLSLTLDIFLARLLPTASSSIQSLLPRNDTHHQVTYNVLTTFYEPQYKMESGGIIKYGTVQTEPFVAVRNTTLRSLQKTRPKFTSTTLKDEASDLIPIGSRTKTTLGKEDLKDAILFRVTEEGSIFWIPEETYVLVPPLFPFVQNGEFIAANTEIASGVFNKSAGLVQIRHLASNQLEVTLRPGVLYSVHELPLDILDENTLVPPGKLILRGLRLQTWSFVELLTLSKKEQQWFLRPALQLQVNRRPNGFVHTSLQTNETQTITKEWAYCLPYADGEYISSEFGVQLLQTCLLHGPMSQQEVQYTIQYEAVNQKVGNDDHSRHVVHTSTLCSTEPKSQALVTNPSAGTLHSLIGTESRSEILILSRNDLLRTRVPSSRSKSLLANCAHVSYEHNAVGLIGYTCLTSSVLYGLRLGSYDTSTKTSLSWLIMDEQATIHSLHALGMLRCAELNTKEWSQLAQLMCEGISLEDKLLCPESGQMIAVDHQSAVLRLARPTLVTAKAAVHTRHAGPVREGDPLITLVYERLRSGDIIQGLPKVEQLLEARSTHARGFHLDHPKSDWKRELLFALEDACMQANRTNFEIRHLQLSLIDEVQRVYQSQGVHIADKHVEIIVRQMTSKALVEDLSTSQLHPFEPRVAKAHFNWLSFIPSYDGCLPGQFIELNRAHKMAYLPGRSIPYRPLLLGITKASFHTDSVLSEASFQQTIRALSLGALQGRIDWLRGLKEKVMIGDLIPAGTGCEEVVWQHQALEMKPRFNFSSHHNRSLSLFYRNEQTLRRCACALTKTHDVQLFTPTN